MTMKKRKQLLKQIGEVTELRQGSLAEQYYTVKDQKGKKHKQGPYYVWTYYRDGPPSRKGSGAASKKICKRIKRDQVPTVRRQIRAYQKAKDLFDEWLDVTEQLTIGGKR